MSQFFPTQRQTVTVVRNQFLNSVPLERTVRLDIVLPPGYDPAAEPYPVLYLNDGQDLSRLRLPAILNGMYRRQALRPFVLVAVHAGERIREYGTAARPDFLGRGEKAGLYTEFVLRELMPEVQEQYNITADPRLVVVAGFSLSGLAAFDLVWHHPDAARRAGVFSGSFWWRSRALSEGYTDADRIMHGLVRHGRPHPQHQFWLQTGTQDETNDRNHNGIIDSIEDTLDLMAAITRGGLSESAVRYVEVVDGRHNQSTWSYVMPDFLQWAFGTGVPSAWSASRPQMKAIPAHFWESSRRLIRRRHPSLEKKTFLNYLAPPSAPAPPMAPITTPPTPDQYLAYYAAYIRHIPEGADPIAQLQAQFWQVQQLAGTLSDEQAGLAYAPGKWTIKEVLVHILDTERIMAYRALRFARGDQQNLPGFEQNDYVPNSGANDRPLTDIIAEYAAVRAATIALFRTFTPTQLDRAGTANNGPASVRALVYIVPGHEAHHLNVLRERYLPLL
ncbi:alpha/beta hydrolase-fold protein [Hymenobacter cavernae]|uniref:DinB-like domain-containing protein n=1 Tax=Hymenobacter cavernae TaxID=2044852 RepID=A0ABQ1TZI2_9BACT|nr:alpha/beta hydrolase-fold protein [Hymenobacter cavernae]GGF06693.1 hypothetical protein GCM10011383_17180 [Hymenobacter cavernae]